MTVELTLDQKAIAIAIVEYLKSEGYILTPEEKKELENYRASDEEYVSGKVAAKLLGCSQARVIQIRKRGLLKYKIEGAVPRYSVKSIKKYNQKRAIGG